MDAPLFDKQEKLPRLSTCYLCKAWELDDKLIQIEVPDQAGWIKKKACQTCLDKIQRGY